MTFKERLAVRLHRLACRLHPLDTVSCAIDDPALDRLDALRTELIGRGIHVPLQVLPALRPPPVQSITVAKKKVASIGNGSRRGSKSAA